MKKIFKEDHTKRVSVWVYILLIGLFTTPAGFSQTRPVNDDLTNSVVLTGTEVTFSGSLAGATLEGDEATPLYSPNLYIGPLTGSIWWSWTAPVTTVLNLKLHPFPQYSDNVDVLAVYSATNGTTSPSGLLLPPLDALPMIVALDNQSISVPVSAGTNYRIQLIGSGSNSYTFHLLATNTPLIIKQPLSETVYSNASTFFYIETAGLLPRTYQWFFNGNSIPGETAPILALNNIDASMTGAYSVLVSNASGSMVSGAAILAISPSNIPPVLGVQSRASNMLALNLNGELGRTYHIESSSNLIDWKDENSFPITPPIAAVPFLGSYVFNSNSSLPLQVTNNAPSSYFRASIYKPDSLHSEICINNLRQIFVAKELWRVETKASSTSIPLYAELVPYFAHPETLVCPDDANSSFPSSYYMESVSQLSRCWINPVDHVLQQVP